MFLKLEDHRSRLQLCYKGPRATLLHSDQAEAQAVCSPQHFCYKGPRGHSASQMTKLRLKQYVLLSTSLGLTKSSNVLLHFILHIVFTPKDVQSLKPKDFVYVPPPSTTAGVADSAHHMQSSSVSFQKDPSGSNIL